MKSRKALVSIYLSYHIYIIYVGKKISDEVKQIMGPSTPQIGYNPESGSLSQQKYTHTIPRRPFREDRAEKVNTNWP